MARKLCFLLVTGALVVAMILSSCTSTTEEETTEGTTVTGEITQPGGTTPGTTTPTTPTVITSKPVYGGSVVYQNDQNPTRWDPQHIQHQPWHVPHLELLTQGDWTKGPQGSNVFPWNNQTVPDDCYTGSLAESWEIPDAKTIIYHLRKGVIYASNNPLSPGIGREMVASDFVYAYERTQAAPKSVVYRAKGTADPNYVYARAIDKYTLEVKLGTPIVNISNGAIASPYPPEAVTKYGDLENWTLSIGTGPYIVSDFVPDSSATFIKNKSYWQEDPLRPGYKLPYLDFYRMLIIVDPATQMAAMQTGKVDFYYATQQRAEVLIKSNPELKWFSRPANYNYVIFMRLDIEPFNNLKVRQALSMAINRNEILDDFMKGYGTFNSWPVWDSVGKEVYVPVEELPADTRQLFEYNPTKAKQLLAEAGYSKGFQVELGIPNVTDLADRAPIIKNYWDAIGVTTTVTVTESGTFYDRMYGKNYKQTVLLHWGNSSVWSVLGWCWRTDILYNYGKVSDKKIDDWFAQAQNETDVTKRNKIFREAYLYGMSQAWEIPLPQVIDYQFYQPYILGYAGEYTSTASHIWIDAALKAKLRK